MTKESKYFDMSPGTPDAKSGSEPGGQDFDEDSWALTATYIPPKHRTEVGKATRVIRESMAKTVDNLLEIGKQLIFIKERLKHGAFLKWIEELGVHPRTAERLMAMHRRLAARAEVFRKLTPTALYQLTMPSTPDVAIDEVAELLLAGNDLGMEQVIKITTSYTRSSVIEKKAMRVAKALRKAVNALTNDSIADCEQILKEDWAHRLEMARTELGLLLDQVQIFLPSAARKFESEHAEVLAPAHLVPVKLLGTCDDVPQLLGTDADGLEVSDLTWPIVPECIVYIKCQDTDERACYTIVVDEVGQPEKGTISFRSPLANALLGKKVGDSATVKTPDGAIHYDITGIGYPDGRVAGEFEMDTELTRSTSALATMPNELTTVAGQSSGVLEVSNHTGEDPTSTVETS